jgi:hypothetical protein
MPKIVQYFDGNRPLYQQCIDQIKKSIPEGVTHELIKETFFTARYDNDYRAVTDVIRLNYLSRDPDMIWLDADTLIKKWIDFEMEKDKVYINSFNEASAIICNGQCDFFKGLLDLYNKDEALNYAGWFHKMLRDNRDKIELIPQGYFVHLALCRVFLNETPNFNNYGTQDFRVCKDSNGELKLTVNF